MASSSTIVTGLISRSEAFKEASDCHSKSFTELCNFVRKEGVKPMDVRGNTILHFLAMYGNLAAFAKLFEDGILTHELLITGNKKGNTALHEAARFGQKGVVQILLNKEKDLVMARNSLGETPLFVAAACGKKDVFNILLKDESHGDNLMSTSDGCNVLHAAIKGEYYSLAMSILESFPHLARNYDAKRMTALDLLATKPLSFKSGSSYSLVKLGTKPFIPLQIIAIFIYFFIPSMIYTCKHGGGDVENQHQKGVNISKSKENLVTRLISGYRWIFRVCPWVREVDDAKQKHVFALALAKRLVEEETTWSRYLNDDESYKVENSETEEKKTLQNPLVQANDDESYKVENSETKEKKTLQNPLVQATENGIIEIVKEILRKFPDAAYSFDKDGKNILHIAVEQKDRILYDYLKKNVDHKNGMLADVDNHGNNVLHLAANLGGTNPRALIGHLNHMTWDMCWFKRVWFDCPPHFLYMENSKGMTAAELFEKNHLDLREKAEKAFKDMNNGLMLVTVLIGTVNYAALFTIPGGYDQDKSNKDGTYGLPVFLNKYDTRYNTVVFLGYISMALFSSLIALGTMLSIQLSRFRSNDFYMTLPFKYLFAMAALFCSTIFTVLACLQVYILYGIGYILNGKGFVKDKHLLFIGGCILMALVYVDVLYLNFYYMYFVIRYSFGYKGQQM